MDIKHKAIHGVKWTAISSAVLASSSLFKLSVLTRYLEKSDFGLMAIVTFILTFFTLTLDMGLPSAILHKQKISNDEYASLYWLNFLISIALYFLAIAITPSISIFYKEKELLTILPLMGLSFIISAFGKQFRIIEQKKLNFKFISITEIISSLFSLLISILLAMKGYGVYSLVYSALALIAVSNLFFLINGVITNGLKLHFSFRETKPFFRIGLFNFGGQIINYLNRDLDILIIGKFFGTEILGGYSLAKQLVFRPTQLINPILTKVSIPTLAKYQKNLQQLKDNYLKLVNIVATINIPIYMFIILFASPIVRIVYGPGFDNIVILVRILSVYMIFIALRNPIGSLIVATGRTDKEFFWFLITSPITFLIILLSCQFSIAFVAIALSLNMAILFYPHWFFLIQKMIHVKFIDYLIACIPNFKNTLNFIRK